MTSFSSELADYRALLDQTITQLDSLIYDIEHFALKSGHQSNQFHELTFDTIPMLRKLKDVRTHAKQSRSHYGPL
jgi:hypothetical protein